MAQAWLEKLSNEECEAYLRANAVGRIALVAGGLPVVVPVNYKVSPGPRYWIVLRTRPGNVIDREKGPVAFEIDGVDAIHERGWSVLIQGALEEVDPTSTEGLERLDPHPWVLADRERWLALVPVFVSGRRLHAPSTEWAFHASAYL